jgi:hypothetical protein
MVMVLSYLQKSLNTQVKLSGESGRPTTDDGRPISSQRDNQITLTYGRQLTSLNEIAPPFVKSSSYFSNFLFYLRVKL